MDTLPSTPDCRLISVDEVAQLLSASPRTVRRLDAAGKLPRGIKIGGLKRWRADELSAWIAAGCPPRKDWETREGA